MDLQPYVDAVRHELSLAASAGGEPARELAERLSAPLESALRLAMLEALAAAAEEITGELAPGSVEVRLRGRDPEFIVTAAPEEQDFDVTEEHASVVDYDDEASGNGGTWRVTLRLPEGLRADVEAAAQRDGASLNSWLVRAAATATKVEGRTKVSGRANRHAQRVTGWVR